MKGLLGDAWDMVSGAWGGLLQTDPDLKARRDQEAKELYDRRAQSPFFQMFGWGEGNNERTEDFSFGNIGKDIGELYRGGATAVTNPAETTKAVTDLAFGGILNLTPMGGLLGEVGMDQREMANEFGSYLKETYGSWDGFLSYAKKNPASAMLDLVAVGFVTKKVVDVATNPLVQKRFMAELDGIVSAAGQNPYMHNIVAPDKQFITGQKVGSGINKGATQDKRVKELEEIVTQVEGSDLVVQPERSIQGMEGEIVMGIMTDRVIAGGTAKKINTASDSFDVDVGQYGGVLFSQLLEAVKRGDAWASDSVALKVIEERIRHIQDTHDITPHITQFILNPTGNNFAHQVTQTMLSALKGKLSKKEKVLLDKKMKEINPNWTGIDSDLESIMRNTSGADRFKMQYLLASSNKKGGYAEQGLSLAEAGVAMTQPQLLGATRGTIPMITKIESDPKLRTEYDRQFTEKSDLHPSYDATIKGDPARPLSENLTIFDLMAARESVGGVGFTGKDFIKKQTIDPTNVTPDHHYATLRNKPPYVQVTDKLLKNLEEQGKLAKGGLLR